VLTSPTQAPALPDLSRPHVLREYALVADGERGALLGPRGGVAWMCFPGWDGDPLFAGLLGAPGVYAVTPVGRFVWGGYYEPGSLIWRSRWACGEAIVECREALAFPGEPGRAVLLRRVEAVHGTARVAVVLDLRADWGRRPVELRRDQAGAWLGRFGAVRVRWSGAAEAGPDPEHGLRLDLELPDGTYRDLVLELDTTPHQQPPPDPDAVWEQTRRAWDETVPQVRSLADRDARHAVAVLRGLTTRGGGMVACATTSLPERAARGRDYDYRYVWIRDQCYAGQAGAAAGVPWLVDDAVRFCSERLLGDGHDLRPVYRSDGSRVPADAQVDLPGYPGAPEVHCGNRAAGQFQLDVLGEALLLFAVAAEQGRLDATHHRAARVAVEAVAARWRQADAGLWELDDRLWTHSRLICVAGLRRFSARAGAAEARQCRDLADAILAETGARSLHVGGRWQRAPDDERVDAALLLAAVRGAVSADDPRSIATLDAVRTQLGEQGFVYRYREGDPALGAEEGAFLLCGFWLSLAELQQGHLLDAVRHFDSGRTACGPPGLFSEEYDVRQRQMRGNLPQAFVHAAMLECAVRLRAHIDRGTHRA
jgi:alpha,alpha-trehalase